MSSSSGLAASNMPPEEQTEARMSNLHADANLNEKALLSSIEDTSFPDMTVQPGDMNTAIKNLTRGILGAPPLGTKAQTVLLSKLADEMKDIRRCLDDVSDHPYLKRCDATLNRAPIVGIKGDDIVYINTISTPLEKVISEKWTLFGPKPDGVNLTEGQANHFFPYQGDLCFAVGRSLWRKRHRSEDDPLINKAVNHWPSLYEDSWEKVGDQCLPDTNLLSVISYAALSMDCTKILFHLIILTGDGTIMVSNNDRLVDAASFQKMSNTRNETVTWKKIAYWNDKVVGLDSNNCTWNLTMNFVEHTYKAEEKLQVRAFSEFTATDMGLVGLGENGTLYRRIVNRELRNQDTNKGILKWESWMPQFGVTSIGVASPGARLDLRGLARILKSRYVESATALYLFFDRLKTFGITHSVYLESHLLDVTKEYQEAYWDDKEKIAVKAGKKMATHTKMWCKVLERQTAMCREAAAKILKDIDDVRTGLNYQKIIIIDQLESAEGFVNILNSDHDKIDAWLWGPIATSVAGLDRTIFSESTGVAMQDFAAAGSLFVGGLIVASSPGERGKNIMDAISNARSEHARLKTSLNLMVFALDTLKRLEDCSKKIHEFWNGMLTNAMILQYMDLATTKRLGEEILKPDNIESSNKATRDFERVNRSLLGILNRDGIRPPIDDDDDDECE